jgi:hypothetical protein
VAALPLTVLDNLRDLCEVGASKTPRAAPALTRTSHTLARAAGRVERLAIMRRGERPTTHIADADQH